MIRYFVFLSNLTTFLSLPFSLFFPLFLSFLSIHILPPLFSSSILSSVFLDVFLFTICSSLPLIKQISVGDTLLIALLSDFYQFVLFPIEVYNFKNRNIVAYIHKEDIESINKQKGQLYNF